MIEDGKVAFGIPSSTLVKGSEFNTKIKTLVKGSTVEEATETDSTVTHMYILSIGNLLENYTKEELEALENVSVSEDDKIKAYYDSSKTTVYIYSDNKIYANEDSSSMFRGFGSLIELDVTQLETSKVTNMASMFRSCSNLAILDLSSFDTSQVTNTEYMFYNDKSLTEITVSDKWVINEGTATTDMFTNCGIDHVTVK